MVLVAVVDADVVTVVVRVDVPVLVAVLLAVEDIDHSRTKTKSPQTNGIVERFHKTVKDEFYSVAFRKKLYTTLEELQADLDAWLSWFNNERTHSGRYCYGKTPMETFTDSRHLAKEKELDLQYLTPGVPTQPSVSDQV